MFNLFKKKKKEETPEPTPIKEEVTYPEGTVECEVCNNPIFQWEKRKTHDKKKFHVKCYRQALKIAKSQISKGIGNL